jgi:hypothetical protein
MAKYAVTHEAAAGTATTTIGDVSATTTVRRIGIYDCLFGSDGTPADTGFEWVVQRTTAHGTRGSAVVPTRLDLADAEMVGDTGQAHTIEPTYTSTEELMDFALNLRATFRWVAAPEGEMIVPATDNAGIGFACNHASATDNQKLTIHMYE